MTLITGQFNDSFPPVMDGVANVAKNYAYWLNKKHGESYVVTPSFPGYTDQEEFTVLRYFSVPLPPRPPYRLGLYQFDFRIKRQIYEIPFDIIHAHSPFGAGKLGLQVARKRGIPIVATFHSKFYDDFKAVVKSDRIARLGVKIVINYFNSVDQVWTINKSSVETLREYGFTGPVEVVYNGTDFQPIADPDKALADANAFLQTAPDERVFLFVGQHIWAKGLKVLIESLRHLRRMDLSFKMVFVGKGPAEAEMRQMVKELGLEQYVRFTGLITDRTLLKSIFCRSDLFLFPSLYDTAGIVVQEAAAVGCPSVVIANSNAAEQVIDNYNGFLAEYDTEKYALRISDALSDQARLREVGRNAANSICKSWEMMVDEAAERYRELIRFKQKTR